MISETRERFIRSIAERLAPERIVEAYFFPSIRQGHVETGAAVIAAWQGRASGTDDARTEVFTATYQWTRKGPDRGKWVVDVVAQADAPLATVETVVRGVQERAGEALDAHRMDGDAVRAVLATPDFGAPTGATAPVVKA